MIKNLLYFSGTVTILLWFLYVLTFIIPFKVYSLEVYVNSSSIASKIYRDFQEYTNSMDSVSKKHIKLSSITKMEKVIVNEDYSRLILGMKETEKFLKNKLAPKMRSKGYNISIIPLGNGIYLAYLSNFVVRPLVDVTKETLDNINDKYPDYLLKENLTDYTKLLRQYFSPVDSSKIAENQFYISKNFLINFAILPYTTSKFMVVNSFTADRITKKDDLVKLQSILSKYNTKSIYLKFETRERIINLRILYRRETK